MPVVSEKGAEEVLAAIKKIADYPDRDRVIEAIKAKGNPAFVATVQAISDAL